MLASVLKTTTFRQSSITLLGTLTNGVLGVVFYILMARSLGPANFGLLTIAIAVVVLITDIFDGGLNSGLIRFVSASLPSNRNEALKILKLSLETKLLLFSLIFTVGFVLSPMIAEEIFKKAALVTPLRLALIGVGCYMLFSYATSILQAYQRFLFWSATYIFSNLLRLAAVLALIYLQKLNLTASIVSFILPPLLGFLLASFVLPVKGLFGARNEFALAGSYFKYSGWLILAAVITTLTLRIDTFLNASLLSSKDVGIYGAASQLASFVPQIIGALGVVSAPKFSGFASRQAMWNFYKKFQLMTVGLAIVGLVGIPLSFYIIPFFFGHEYLGSIPVFAILLVAMLISLTTAPSHDALRYYFKVPQVFTRIYLLQLLVLGGAGYILVTKFGVVGTAVAVLIATTVNLVASLGYFFLAKVKRTSPDKYNDEEVSLSLR